MMTKAGAWLFTDLMTNDTPFRHGDEVALGRYITDIENEAVSTALSALSKEIGNIELFSNNFYMDIRGQELVPIETVKKLIAEATP